MKKLKLLIFLLVCTINPAHSAFFKPEIIEGDNNHPACQLALKHYETLFYSDAPRSKSPGATPETNLPVFENYSSNDDTYRTATINIDGTDRLLIYYSRTHSWRGNIYSAYLLDPNEGQGYSEKLNDKNRIYPPNGLDFSWQESHPFNYQGKWYVIDDAREFLDDGAKRSLYQLKAKSKPQKLCTIMIHQNFDDHPANYDNYIVKAYFGSVETIMNSGPDCGTLKSGLYSRDAGREFFSNAYFRPWAIQPTWSPGNWWSENNLQQTHFKRWQFQDVWSQREYLTLQNLKSDAIAQLTTHYANNFRYSEKQAKRLATNVIEAMPGRYYRLGNYEEEKYDFSIIEDFAQSKMDSWDALSDSLKSAGLGTQGAALSLAIDNTTLLDAIFSKLELTKIKSRYAKDMLMYAAHMNQLDTVKYLIEKNFPIDNVTDSSGMECDFGLSRYHRSALTYAAENASIHLIKYLVDSGANLSQKDSKGNDLNFYLQKNPRFSDDEKKLGLTELLKKYSETKITPSFNCSSKLNKLESSICNSESLPIYDQELAITYKTLLQHKDSKDATKTSQRAWIKRRNQQCSRFDDPDLVNACLARKTRARTRYLRSLKRLIED